MNKLTGFSVKNGYRATCNHYCKVIYPLFLTLLVLLLTSPVQAKYSGGTGEPNNPYRIATADDLNDIGNHMEDFNKCFLQVNDVNLSEYTGTELNIIGPNSTTPFTGFFDGNGHTISNFTYDSNSNNCIGIFGYVGIYNDSNTVIKNLTLIDPNVDAGTGSPFGGPVGSLIGMLYSGCVSDCSAVGGIVSGKNWVGGLIGAIGTKLHFLSLSRRLRDVLLTFVS
ncbi:MAG: hypothetical protein JXB29_12650 [Sedimentisphaerales bacterium]|nr:hypothetical protein [Sedimentisphaerales bacterium]